MKNMLSSVSGLSRELSIVDEYIDELLGADTETNGVAEVFGSIRGSRGKMIRPILLLLTARFGPAYKGARQRLYKLGALIEIVHMASLIHDDIIDDSPLRRRRPTIQHQFGKDIAVYAGDYMISRVFCHLAEEHTTQEVLGIGRTIENMCRGELRQMNCRWNTETTIETYLRNICGKCVSLFIEAARLGAAGGGADEKAVNCLASIGEHLGYMFQMRDDLLDFISDQQKEGKPVHRDFADGIYTLPVLYALQQPGSGARLREIAGVNNTDPNYGELLLEMRELTRQSGGIDFTLEQMDSHARQARMQLSALPSSEVVQGIEMLIDQMLKRDA